MLCEVVGEPCEFVCISASHNGNNSITQFWSKITRRGFLKQILHTHTSVKLGTSNTAGLLQFVRAQQQSHQIKQTESQEAPISMRMFTGMQFVCTCMLEMLLQIKILMLANLSLSAVGVGEGALGHTFVFTG